jgi:hypothetical protein
MFDPTTEPPIPLMEVPRIPWMPRRRGNRKVNISTVFRWAQRGLRGIKLETIQLGGTKCTSEAALQRFFASLTDAAAPQTAPTPRVRRQQLAQTDRELTEAGLL